VEEEKPNELAQNKTDTMAKAMEYLYFSEITESSHIRVACLRRAAEYGLQPAQFKLAMLYLAGQDVDKDVPLGLSILEQAADGGYAEAQFVMGLTSEHGTGGKKDVSGARCWYLRAAEQGCTEAQYCLALLYLAPEKLSLQDQVEAYIWLRAVVSARPHPEAERRIYILEKTLPEVYLGFAQYCAQRQTDRNSLTDHSKDSPYAHAGA